VHLHLQGNKATLSIDLADGSRHRRGYRTEAGDAPLSEVLAAAVLAHARYDGTRPLLDPMCGSGTLLGEALLAAGDVPAGFACPRFGFERLPGIDAGLFARVRSEVDAAVRTLPDGTIRGCDRDRDVLNLARGNLARVPGGEEVRLRAADFRDHDGLEDGVIVCNPPWGIRLGDLESAARTVRDFGDFLKQRCRGSEAWLLLGERELLKHVGLKPTQRIPFPISGRDGRLARYELY
jgi:putative N6-adenine-specific DNA methylase